MEGATDSSSIYLLWADFGAGKTHALRYVQHLATTVEPPALAIYADLTQAPDSFVDIFRRIGPSIPELVLTDAIKSFRQQHPADWLSQPVLRGDRATPQALWALATLPDSPAAETVRGWLRCEPIRPSLGSVAGGISTIRSGTDAQRVLASIINVVLMADRYRRVILLLDEYQRLQLVSTKRMQDVNSALKGVYDNCPEGFTLLLTYSIGAAEQIKYMTSDDLRSRVADRLSLTPLTTSEAAEFLTVALDRYAVDSRKCFDATAIDWIADQLATDLDQRITPRTVMQAARSILIGTVEDGLAFPINAKIARRYYRKPDDSR